jgi:hypothetical protein
MFDGVVIGFIFEREPSMFDVVSGNPPETIGTIGTDGTVGTASSL